MSKILANSPSPSPFHVPAQHSSTTNGRSATKPLTNGTNSFNATPAPEHPTPVVASGSGAGSELISVVDEPIEEDNVQALGAREKHEAEAKLEAVARRVRGKATALGRTPEEEQIMLQTATRVVSYLASDHFSVLCPDVDTPFTDPADVVRRLLPYHVFQQPQEDLGVLSAQSPFTPSKGKHKATEEDMLREEIAETRFAIECWKRRTALERRFRRTRIQSGTRASPDDQAYFLAQTILEVERAETASLNAELRSARTELGQLEREKRAIAPPPTSRTATPATYYSTPTATTPSGYATQYRQYTYPYTSTYATTPYTLSPAFKATYNSTDPNHTNHYLHSPYTSAVASALTTPAPAPSPTYSPASTAVPSTPQPTPTRPTVALIPVQLPLSSVPALKAIGLEPVPASSVPPADQPQPAAVLKSQTATTMNVDINVGSLQPQQMQGLALILSALTSGGGHTSDGNAGAPPGGPATGDNGTPSTATAASTAS